MMLVQVVDNSFIKSQNVAQMAQTAKVQRLSHWAAQAAHGKTVGMKQARRVELQEGL